MEWVSGMLTPLASRVANVVVASRGVFVVW